MPGADSDKKVSNASASAECRPALYKVMFIMFTNSSPEKKPGYGYSASAACRFLWMPVPTCFRCIIATLSAVKPA